MWEGPDGNPYTFPEDTEREDRKAMREDAKDLQNVQRTKRLEIYSAHGVSDSLLLSERDAIRVATKNSRPGGLLRLSSSMTSMRRKRWNPGEKLRSLWVPTFSPRFSPPSCAVGSTVFPLGSTIFSFPGNISDCAAASPLLRAVVPRCPAPTGGRVSPRPETFGPMHLLDPEHAVYTVYM